MKPEIIVMLTHHDQTVENAFDLFSELKDTPVGHWGFKDVGLPHDQMKELVGEMNAAGKTTYLEVVSLAEEEGLAGAELAVECGFDILMGTVFFDSINDYIKDKPVQYYPFPGRVHSHPSILDGSPEEIVAHTRDMASKGVDGFDLLTYRYTGDPVALLPKVVRASSLPVVSAGSIDSFDRVAEVRDADAFGFTIGTAFFEKKFVPGGSFKENMMAVWDWIQKNGRPD
jgi:hypothetical protein